MKRCVVLCCSLIAHTSPSAICLPDRRSFLLHPPCPPSIPPPSPPSRLPSDSSSRRTSTTPRSLRSSRRMSSFRCDSQTQSRRREAEATASRPLDATCSAARPVAGKRTGAGQVSWRTQLTTALRLAFSSLSVSAQIKSGSYDGESNRELLKLYAVAPDMIRLVSGEACADRDRAELQMDAIRSRACGIL